VAGHGLAGSALVVGMYLRETRRTNKDGSVARYLQLAHNERHPGTGGPAAKGEVRDSGRRGGGWTLDRIGERLEMGQAIRRVAAGRRVDGTGAERVIFALAAQRALEPASKLAAPRWVAERVLAGDCPGFSDDQAYRAM